MYLLLTAVRRPPPLEVEVAPVSASRLLKKVVYPLSWSDAATCISCAWVAIPVSWSTMAKPPSWGSMPVMRCSLSVQVAGPRRRRSVSRRDWSGGTRPLRRFHERSHSFWNFFRIYFPNFFQKQACRVSLATRVIAPASLLYDRLTPPA